MISATAPKQKTTKTSTTTAKTNTNKPSTIPIAPIFNTQNAQSDGKSKLKRIEFEFLGKSYKFALNPEEYNQPEPSKATITQTKGGAFIDDFGAGIITIYMKGTTGFKGTTKGFTKFKELRDLIRSVYNNIPPGTNIPDSKELIYHNYTDGEHWVVYPSKFNLMRSIARPLLYLYEMNLWVLRAASVPKTSLSTKVLSPTPSKVEVKKK